MASTESPENSSRPPRTLHPTRSFTRMESTAAHVSPRNRAKTMQEMSTTGAGDSGDAAILQPAVDVTEHGPDIFEKRDSVDSDEDGGGHGEQSVETLLGEDGLHELPIELASMTDRFVQSLSARVHSTPPSIEKIATLFQEFYLRADSHIATHISALASRINRDGSPASASQKDGGKATTRQMLTASEVTERRKARKQLPYKRLALEETVERRACEKIHDKIWRHKSTLDEVRDEKLRSKTAALSLLGIGLKDLGIEFPGTDEGKEAEASSRLAPARDWLSKMNEAKYPLGKLQCLKSAHKAIVDTLTTLLGSSSSADEILPTLIYTLITSPSEGINVISNLLFIQRFRSASKMDGESAYCLTNLEAAISFLEAVDLTSLSGDIPADGQPRLLNAAMTTGTDVESSPLDTATAEFAKSGKDSASSTLSRSQLGAPIVQQRRLSNLFQPPSKVLGAANDAVRNTADQGLKNLSNALDNSFNFVVGRMKEMQSNRGANEQPLVPKTLDEARRLVTSPPVVNDSELASELSIEDATTREGGRRPSSTLKPEDLRNKTPRDRSADSVRSSESKRSGMTAARLNTRDQITPSPSGGSSIFNSGPTTPLESMKHFGNTFNPLNHIPGMIRGLGRNTPETPVGGGSSSSLPDRMKPLPTDAKASELEPSSTAVAAAAARLDPPIRRFIEVQDAQDLRVGDVAALLQDYKRLAAALAAAHFQSNQ